MEVATGTLSVATSPWTSVYVDGEFRGRAPFTGLTVSAGTHRLRFVNEPAGVDREETINVVAGGTTAIRRTAAQLGADLAATAPASPPDAGSTASSPGDVGRTPDGIRIRAGVYGRDAQ